MIYRGPQWECMDPVSREKIKSFPASRKIFWSYPVPYRAKLCRANFLKSDENFAQGIVSFYENFAF